jgi:hypothetical protein
VLKEKKRPKNQSNIVFWVWKKKNEKRK